MDKLDYIEQSGRDTMTFHIDCMEALNRESHVTLSFALAGMAASFAAGLKVLEGDDVPALALALLATALYFAVLGYCVTRSCLHVADVMPPGNEPANLLLAFGDSLDEIRKTELNNLQTRIEFNRRRNDSVAASLNFCRKMLCATPAIFLAAWGLAAVVLAGVH